MPDYKAPVRDINFVINEVLESEKLYKTLPGYEEATAELMSAIVEEGAKFAENEFYVWRVWEISLDVRHVVQLRE